MLKYQDTIGEKGLLTHSRAVFNINVMLFLGITKQFLKVFLNRALYSHVVCLQSQKRCVFPRYLNLIMAMLNVTKEAN